MKRKKHQIISCAAIAFLFLYGCAANPSTSAVAQKNAGRLAEQAADSTASDRKFLSDLKEAGQQDVSRYSFSYESDDQVVSIHADAPIVIPDASQIPSYRIKCDGFTQEQVSGMYDFLLKGKNPYHLDESYEKIPSDGTIQTYLQSNNSSYSGLDVQTDDNCYFVLMNSYGSSHDLYPSLLYGIDTQETGLYYDGSHGIPVSEDEADSLLSSSVSIRLADAKKQAEDFFNAAGTRATLQQVYLVQLADLANGTLAKSDYEEGYSAIRLIYSPIVASIPVGMNLDHSGSDYSISWPLEQISFVISDAGFLEIRWESPTQITETISENTSLISFEQASKIFEQMCPLIYAGKAASIPNATYDIQVTKVELCLFRVRDTGSSRTGLLVPAWLFYGDEGLCISHSNPISSELPNILLAINAVDQTIIDLTQGY